MEILLIGGSGNISPAIARELLAGGHRLTVFNRGHHPVEGAAQMIGNRDDHEDFVRQMRGRSFDVVFDQICFTARHAQDLVDAFAGRIKQLVFCSTVNTYVAPAPSYPITESTPIGADPAFEYAWEKVQCEQILQAAAEKCAFHLTIVRPGATYNDSFTPISFLGSGAGLLYRLSQGKPVLLLGDGSSLWGHAHRDDVGKAIAHAAGNERAYGESYTIAAKEVMTWEQIYTVIAEEMGAPAPQFVYAPYFVLDALTGEKDSWNKLNFRFNNIFDCSKAERDLGYRYTVTWREGVRRFLAESRKSGVVCAAAEDPRYDGIVRKIKKMYSSLF